jgi:predicted DNA-binding protein
MTSRFRRYSINLDSTSHERCKNLANEMSTTVSGVVRFLIRNAFEQQQDISKNRMGSESYLQA